MVPFVGPGGLRQPVLLYVVSFFVIGLSITMLGPAVSQLRDRTESGIGDIGILFVAESAGYFAGSLLGGRSYDRFDGHRVFAAALAVLGTGLFLVPSVDALGGLFAAFVIIGVGAGAVGVGANTLVMWQLGAGVGRAMNTLHLCFGLGALSAPLLVHAGLNVAARSAAVGCVLLAWWAVSVSSPTAPAAARAEHADATPRLLGLLAPFFLLYAGLEIGFAGWIHTYGEEIDFSGLAAAWLTTTFWISFTVGRLLSSLLAQRFRPKVVLSGGCSLAIGAALVLVVGDGRAPAVWGATALMGLATAPQFPVMLTYLERRINVTGIATSWFVGAAGLGGLVFPWLIGRWLDSGGATALPASVLILAALTFASFGVSNRRLGVGADATA